MKFVRTAASLSVLILSACASGAATAPSRHNFPLILEKNQGQAPSQARYLTHSGTLTALFTADGVQFVHSAAPPVSWQLLGAAATEPQGRDPLPSHTSYFPSSDSSQWIGNVENDAEIVYSQVYLGIDLIFHSASGRPQLEHDFRIAPNADPTQIAFHFSGASTPTIDAQGNLSIATGPNAEDSILLHKPVAYQTASDVRVPVSAEFLVAHNGTIRFRLGRYDRSKPLTIDPVFAFSTYLAGTGGDQPNAVATDSAGNIYVTGTTGSLNFPLKNPIEKTPPAAYGQTIFVSSFDPTGNALRFSTYLGTGSANQAYAIAIDPKGNVLVAGLVSNAAFPHAGNLPALNCEINGTCFVLASLTSTGDKLNFAGEAGGLAGGSAGAHPVLTSDGQGNAYLAGITADKNFPITPGTLSPVVPGDPPIGDFVMKVDPTGKLVYATIVPNLDSPPQSFNPAGIVVDAKGQATVAGSGGDGLPTTPGVLAYNPPHPNQAGVLLQLNAEASAINYATYLPGTDSVLAFTQDKSGNSWLTGVTTEPDLPTSSSSYQKSIPPGLVGQSLCSTGFILEVNPTGTASLAATYLGSTYNGCGTSFSAIALDSKSNVYVGGYTGDPAFPFKDPVTDSTLSTLALAALNPSLTGLEFGSLLGPPDYQSNANFGAMTVDPSGNLIVVGNTIATDFPTTAGSFQPVAPKESQNTTEFGFVSKLDLSIAAPSACLDTRSIQWTDQSGLITQSAVAHLTNCGNAPLVVKSIVSSSSNFTLKDTCTTLAPNTTCPISITYTPAPNSALSGGTITIADNAQLPTQTISVAGSGYLPFPFLEASPSGANFGDVLVGATAASAQISIVDGSTVPIEIQSVSVLGDFAIPRNQCTGWLQGRNASCTVTLAFKPTAPGLRAGQLTVLGDGNTKLIVPLFGRGDTAYRTPLVLGLASPTVQIGGEPQTITVNGSNFYPESVVKIGSLALPTTYISGTQLTAALAPSALANASTYAIYVSNPTPGGGSSNAVVLTAYRVVPIEASALAAVPGSTTLYAAIPAHAHTDANTVIPIATATGATGTPIPAGNNPALLSATGDGKYLYVANNGDLTIQRINLATRKVEATFPYPNPNTTVCQNCNFTAANDLQAVPGDSLEVAVAFPTQVALYNQNGLVNYSPKSATETSPTEIQSLAFAGSPLTLYAQGFSNGGSSNFFAFKLAANGVTYMAPAGTWPQDVNGTQIVSDGTLLYSNSGIVLNPATQKQVGSFAIGLPNPVGLGTFFNLTSDPATQSIFALAGQPYGETETLSGLQGNRWKTLTSTGSLTFPDLSIGTQTNPVRFGTTGLALLSPGNDPEFQQVIILDSDVVSAATSNPKPSIAGIDPPSVAQQYTVPLLITGSGIQPDTQVYWNGAPIAPPQIGPSTVWLNTNALLVNLAQASTASVGTFNLTLVNPAPGGGASAPRPFSITAPSVTLAISPTALNFPATTHGTKSAPQSIVLADDNSEVLAIASTAISGPDASSFSTQRSNCTTLGGGGSCVIQVIFQPTTAGTFTATLKIATNAPGSPQSISLTGTGK